MPASGPIRRAPSDHGRLDPRLQPADLLGRADADHGLRRRLRWLPSTGRGATGTIFGITTSFATLDGLPTCCCRRSIWRCSNCRWSIRLTRAGVRENMLMDYVKFARAKGLSMRRVVFVHVLKNILIPIVTVIGLELGSADRLRGRDGDNLRLARHGQTDHRFDQPARPARDRRVSADHVFDVHLHQPHGRHPLFARSTRGFGWQT